MAAATQLTRLEVRLSACLIFFLISLLQTLGSRLTSTSGCACPGDTLTYECTAMGRGVTIWTGTAFNCSESNNEISLLHNRFSSTEGDYGSCNNGSIVGQSLGIEGNNYTSQLNVTVTPDTAGTMIMCLYYNFYNDSIQLSTLIPPTGPLSPPDKVWISNVDFLLQREATFAWSPVAPDCPAIHYNILASNCGSCPTTTNHTNVTCTDIPTNRSTCTCTFAIQTITCGNITGNTSDPISVNFDATEPMRVTTSIPHPTENQNQATHNLDTTKAPITSNSAANTVNTISISSLAIALTASVVVSVTVIAVILARSKAKIKALELQLTNSSTHMEPMYEEATGPLPSASTINTQDNVAYGHT